MTLRQLLLTGKLKDIKDFFKGAPLSVLAILIVVTKHIQSYPEELRTKEWFLNELYMLRDETDLSEYTDVGRDILKALSGDKNWIKYLNESIKEIEKC